MRAAGNGGIACCNSRKGVLLHRRAIEQLDFTILQEINQIGKWVAPRMRTRTAAAVSRDAELFLAAMFVQDIVRTDGIFVRV